MLSEDGKILRETIWKIDVFLRDALKLALHERKIIIRKFSRGIDFLGYVILPHYRVVRTKTKRRILKKLNERRMAFKRGNISDNSFNQSLQSYLGVLTHCQGFKIEKKLRLIYDG